MTPCLSSSLTGLIISGQACPPSIRRGREVACPMLAPISDNRGPASAADKRLRRKDRRKFGNLGQHDPQRATTHVCDEDAPGESQAFDDREIENERRLSERILNGTRAAWRRPGSYRILGSEPSRPQLKEFFSTSSHGRQIETGRRFCAKRWNRSGHIAVTSGSFGTQVSQVQIR